MRVSIRQKLFGFSAIIIACNGFIGFVLLRNHQQMLDSKAMVDQTENIIYQAGNVVSVAKDLNLGTWICIDRERGLS